MAIETPKTPRVPRASNPRRDLFAAAALVGIYFANGRGILAAAGLDYTNAIARARQIAFEQADEMLKESGT